MSVEAAGRSGDWAHFEVGDGVVDDVEVGFEVGVVGLLEEEGEFVFDFFGLVEEVELIALVVGEHVVDKFLEFLGACGGGEFVGAKGDVSVVDEVHDDVFGDFKNGFSVLLDAFPAFLFLHDQQSL